MIPIELLPRLTNFSLEELKIENGKLYLIGVSSGYAQKVVTSKKMTNFSVDYCRQPHKMPFEYL